MNLRHSLAGLLAASLLLCSGCNKSAVPAETAAPTEAPAAEPAATPAPTSAPEESGQGVYTLREALYQQPGCWNPHTWRTEADHYLLDYTVSPLLHIRYGSETGEADTWYCQWELADSAEDITADWAQREAWGIREESGRVWRIHLNQNARWDDEACTPITADDYLNSMKLCLDPEVQNLRAEVWTSGETAIQGAAAYYYAGGNVWKENAGADSDLLYPFDTWVLGQDGQYRGADGTGLWFSLDAPLQTCLGGNSLSDYYRAGYLPESVYTGLTALSSQDGYIPVTEDSMALLYAFTGSDTWGREKLSDLAGYVLYSTAYPAVGWDGVGLLKEDDYTLIYITESSVSRYAFLLGLTTPWLVYTSTYSPYSYAVSPESTVSCGPYRLLSCTDGRILLERNENWCGGSQRYPAQRIQAAVVSSYEAALALFQDGELDVLPLKEEDHSLFRDDHTLISLESGYVQRLILVTDRNALLTLQAKAGTNENKTCLSLEAFRTALSLSVDREALAKATVPGGSAALGLLNRQYYLNGEQDAASVYRDTDAGMAAICRGYGVSWGEGSSLRDAYAACTGYDPERARLLFGAAYSQLVDSGDWTEGMTVSLTCAVSGSELSPLQSEQNALLQAYLDAATQGTGFEGRLTITYRCTEDPYTAVKNGQVEMALGAWGGAAFDTYSMMQCWCDPSLNAVQERCGFDPVSELLTITLNGEPVTRSYQHWCQSILTGAEYSADPALRLLILSELEAALLNRRCCIPLFSLGQAVVISDKVLSADTAGSLLFGWGGAEQLSLLYDDAQWASFIK